MNEVAPGICVLPVRTPTLPPATHTNTWVAGEGRMWVFDPASPYDDERARTWSALRDRIDAGERVEAIVLTHHHHDHVSGARDLQRRLAAHGAPAPIVGHAANAAWLAGGLALDETWSDKASIDCGGLTLTAHHTPGHAPGHLIFHDAASGAVIAGDLVAGVGTIALGPDDGDLALYLASLAHTAALKPSVLLPAHGPALHQPNAVLAFYIAHRHQRTDQIRAALDAGAATPDELVPRVYTGLDPRARPLAAAQILTHLRWLATHGLASAGDGGRWSR